MIAYIIILIIILISVGGYFWYNNHVASSIKVIEYQDFSCPEITGFTFKYPVFEGWKIAKPYSSNRKGECIIELNFPENLNFYQRPRIIVTETPEVVKPNLSFKNPNNVFYDKNGEESYDFRIEKKLITISSPEYPNDGFFRDQFFKTVIESFKLVE